MSDLKTPPSAPNEGRGFPRRHLLYYLLVTDVNRNVPLGRLGDLNNGGILILTERELPLETVYPASIEIPERLNLGKTSLELVIRTRWIKKEPGRNLYSVGSSIENMAEKDRVFISRLIDRIGFSDGSKKIFLHNDKNVFQEPEQ